MENNDREFESIIKKKYYQLKRDEDADKKYYIPKILYHYTDQHGLLGILGESNKKSTIWASDIQFLNDKSEFTKTFQEIKNIVKSSAEHFPNLDSLEDTISKQYDNTLVYSFSLSMEKNLLSQWRAYCPLNGGFSIGFNYRNLRKLIEQNSNYKLSLLPCFYDEKFKNTWLLKHYLSIIDNIFNHGIPIQSAIDNFIKQSVLLCAIFKHKSFSEENEWRLFCIKKSTDHDPVIKFRPGKSFLIPFIEIGASPKTKFIDEIWIGPCPDQDLSKGSLEYLRNKLNLSFNIEKSDIPFRNW